MADGNDPMTGDKSDVDERLAELRQRAYDLGQTGQFRTEIRVATEMRRLAKSEHRLMPYMESLFSIMGSSSDCLDPRTRLDCSLELIGLLESDDQARTIEANYDEGHYSYTQSWMTACAYDNLAIATGEMKGYNSDGMHQCISDGIAVCHRTGKLQCITCFRKYAIDVYTAADDIEMALSFARREVDAPINPANDRRFTNHRALWELLVLTGQLEAATETIRKSWELRNTHHNPAEARRNLRNAMREVAALMGQPELFADLQKQTETDPPLAAGECLADEMAQAFAGAIEDLCRGEHAQAIATIAQWDKQLLQRDYLHEWFRARLRLMCAYRLAGKTNELSRLAEPLRERAAQCRDWVTIRLLDRLLDPATRPAPLYALHDFSCGPFSGKDPHSAAPVVEKASASSATPDASADVESSADVPLPSELVQRVGKQIAEIPDRDPDGIEERVRAVCESILAVAPETLADDREACWLLYFLGMVVGEPVAKEAWDWATQVHGRYPQVPAVMNLVAHLGACLQARAEEFATEAIDDAWIESQFRQSLEMDSMAQRGYFRAGQYFLGKGNLGEAERCFARSFRLKRDDQAVALALSEVYENTDRQRDALEVLDLCLREGGEGTDLLYRAGLLARGLSQAEISLAYFDRLETISPGMPFVHYYRALSLLDLDRPQEALEAARKEFEQNPDSEFATQLVSAIALGHLQHPSFAELVEKLLLVRVSTIDNLSRGGLSNLHYRLWQAAAAAEQPQLQSRIETRLLETNLAPDELFQFYRSQQPVEEGIGFFQVELQQPLDGSWNESFAVLPGEEDWPCYHVVWEVLARDEDAAIELAQQWQRRAWNRPAEVMSLNQNGQYNDSPGVISQSGRFPPPSDEDE
jgi:tetratricopeptide (TPR) repeat protein